MHLYNFCCLRVVQIPLPPRFCWHLLFKPTFDIPILFLPFAMVGLFSLFGQKCTIYILSKSCFFCDICKSRLLDSELLVHCCTRLSVGMTWDWSKQRANDRYKDHLDSRWAINLPGTWLWWLVLSTAFKEHGFAAVLVDTLFMIYL